MVIRTQKARKLQTLIEVCTYFSSLAAPAHLHRPAEQTFAVHQQMETPYAEEDCESEAVFAVGDRPPWANRRRQIRPVFPHCNRCSHWPAIWDMRCVPLPDNQIPHDNNKGTDRLPIKNGDSVLRHRPVETTPRSSVSAAANSDTCNPVARDRTLHYHSSQPVGFSNRTVVNREMAIVHRETPPRPGTHPHRSTHTSFDPHLISAHLPVIGFFITGLCDHLNSSTKRFEYGKKAPCRRIMIILRHGRCLHLLIQTERRCPLDRSDRTPRRGANTTGDASARPVG